MIRNSIKVDRIFVRTSHEDVDCCVDYHDCDEVPAQGTSHMPHLLSGLNLPPQMIHERDLKRTPRLWHESHKFNNTHQKIKIQSRYTDITQGKRFQTRKSVMIRLNSNNGIMSHQAHIWRMLTSAIRHGTPHIIEQLPQSLPGVHQPSHNTINTGVIFEGFVYS
ncbi:unnamed protein product [Trifolium pratense]|uniref:Uncharacterized protein n=1 Tax=Trifolium pratense TaxID=57577 RepID=A0ACB0JEP8_TRIPR|nr:unnamed protein product [Trifolium pratense]